MGFDKGRRGDRGGRGRDRYDGFGGDNFGSGGGGGGDRFGGGGGDRFGGGGGGGDRFGGGGGGGGDRFGGGGGGGGGGGFRGGGGGGRPQMPAQVVGEGSGVVKFFNAQKGFGFVAPDDGSADIFVHISAVEVAGLTGLADGQPMSYTMVDRGGRISATDIKIDGEPLPVTDRPPNADRGDRPERSDRGGDRGGGFGAPRRAGPARELTGEKGAGTVKFFNAMKGFGFVQRDDGQADVFVHISAVERAGMAGLKEGDRIGFDVEVDARGKYAAVNISPEG